MAKVRLTNPPPPPPRKADASDVTQRRRWGTATVATKGAEAHARERGAEPQLLGEKSATIDDRTKGGAVAPQLRKTAVVRRVSPIDSG